MCSWCDFVKNITCGTSVAKSLDSTRHQQILENRQCIQALARVILFCGRQGIALRDHREADLDRNRGNYLELLELIAVHDSVVADKLHNGPRNATYTSPNIQNSLLNILGNMIRKKICGEVREAGAYSILCDETKDYSKQEQLSLIVRYVDNKAVIHEHFLTYMEVKDLDAKSLTGYIVSALETYCLDPKLIVSRGYDGASVMSGSCTGVQTRLKELLHMQPIFTVMHIP